MTWKTKIVKHYGLGECYKKLSQRFQLSFSTVRNIVRKWKAAGTVVKARSGRPRKIERQRLSQLPVCSGSRPPQSVSPVLCLLIWSVNLWGYLNSRFGETHCQIVVHAFCDLSFCPWSSLWDCPVCVWIAGLPVISPSSFWPALWPVFWLSACFSVLDHKLFDWVNYGLSPQIFCLSKDLWFFWICHAGSLWKCLFHSSCALVFV